MREPKDIVNANDEDAGMEAIDMSEAIDANAKQEAIDADQAKALNEANDVNEAIDAIDTNDAKDAKDVRNAYPAHFAYHAEDKRDIQLLEKDTNPLQVVLHLVRHGVTRWNQERRYLGHEDQGVISGELERLAPLARRLQGMHWTRVYCSDLLRCRQTLRYLLTGNEVQSAALSGNTEALPLPGTVYDRRLRELHFGEWEGKTYEDLKGDPLYRRWIEDPAAVTPPGGESWEAFSSRIQHFLAGMHQDLSRSCGKDENGEAGGRSSQKTPDLLVVTHGGVIRQIAAATVPDTPFWSLRILPGEELRLKLAWNGQRWQGEIMS
ncbi:histidine phosphatase family protein [Paenibacillus ihbetae]|uniref:histidine phosphatase family protein n=1 Tax=Paenibacillus ihbetae TaxID=1870820 RepID=UPI001CB94F92|nr:histidine phosphatase family protein [Paenibacillus ihbetae]